MASQTNIEAARINQAAREAAQTEFRERALAMWDTMSIRDIASALDRPCESVLGVGLKAGRKSRTYSAQP